MCRTRTQFEMALHVYDPACDWEARMLEREHSCPLCNNSFEGCLFQHVVSCIARAWFALSSINCSFQFKEFERQP